MIPEVSTTSNLRSLLKGSKVIDNQKQKEPSPKDRNVTVSSKKDSITQRESLNEGKINESISQWTMWEYLSTSSNNVTIHVRDPSAYAETEKKTQLPRKKPTVAELSKKILITRERIQKETIPWRGAAIFSFPPWLLRRSFCPFFFSFGSSLTFSSSKEILAFTPVSFSVFLSLLVNIASKL